MDLPGALQEEILTSLCWDKDAIPIIVNTINVSHFTSKEYRKIAQIAKDHWFSYKEPIGFHLPGELEEELKGEEGKIYKRLIDNLFLTKDDINNDYLIKKIENVVTSHNVKETILTAHKCILRGDTDGAEKRLLSYKESSIKAFDRGLNFGADFDGTFRFLEKEEDDRFMIGIPQLDMLGICPKRKRMFVVFAVPGRGKSWFCINIAKINSVMGRKVLYVTLEMDRDSVAQRLVQSFYWVAKSETKFRDDYMKFSTNSQNRLMGFEASPLDERVRFLDNKNHMEEIRRDVRNYQEWFKNGLLTIQDFASGATVSDIEAFLDKSEMIDGVTYDLLIVDYPEEMKLNPEHYRFSLSETNKGLRRIVKQRNMGLVIPFQGNREGLRKAFWLTGQHLSEDYSILKTADGIISLNMTDAEKEIGVMRPYVLKYRDDLDGMKLIVSHNYYIGQVCLDSAFLTCGQREYGEIFRGMTNMEL